MSALVLALVLALALAFVLALVLASAFWLNEVLFCQIELNLS